LKKETAALSADDVKKVFAALPKNKWFTAHRAMLAVGFYTGLRSAEIRHLKVGDYGAIDGHRVLNLLAKGDVRHEVPITPFVVRCLDEHLEGLKALGFALNSADYLFPRLHPKPVNEPISQVALRNLFLRKLGAAEIKQSPLRRYCPHSMRATLATHLLTQADVPLEDVARLLGHRNPATTKTYIKEEKHHDKSPVYKIGY
jgi:integrase